jgi:gas vesicle protein
LIGGAKLGAMAGSFLGPVGTAVGGVVGGAAGMFFGDQAGQILGEAAGFWFNELREADIPGKIMEAWDTLVKDFKTGWDDIIKKAEKAFDWFGDITDAANQYIKEKTGIDIKAKVGEAYDTVKEDFLLGWHDAVAKAKKGIEWAKENTTVGKAIARFTGDGTIRGMNKDQTKAFAEDVQRTESGGNQRAENKLGFIGSYQVGADVLADSGLVDLAKLKEAKRKSGNNWLSGGQTEFLNNSDNWLMDGGKEAFLNNIDLQNKTFLEGTNRNISVGMRSGALSRSASAEEIGAYAKAAHLGGAGGANDYFLRGKDISDINKTNLSKYANDGMMAVRNAPVATASVPSPQVPAMPPPPPIAEAPVLREPLGSGFDDRYVSLNVPQGEVGQNLSDRSIAHIVTGGIGAPV